MKYIKGEYAQNTFTVARWFINLLVILGMTAFVIICSFAWGYLL